MISILLDILGFFTWNNPIAVSYGVYSLSRNEKTLIRMRKVLYIKIVVYHKKMSTWICTHSKYIGTNHQRDPSTADNEVNESTPIFLPPDDLTFDPRSLPYSLLRSDHKASHYCSCQHQRNVSLSTGKDRRNNTKKTLHDTMCWKHYWDTYQ